MHLYSVSVCTCELKFPRKWDMTNCFYSRLLTIFPRYFLTITSKWQVVSANRNTNEPAKYKWNDEYFKYLLYPVRSSEKKQHQYTDTGYSELLKRGYCPKNKKKINRVIKRIPSVFSNIQTPENGGIEIVIWEMSTGAALGTVNLLITDHMGQSFYEVQTY